MGQRDMIRRAQVGDLPDLIRMAGRFAAVARPDLPIDDAYLAGSFRSMIASGQHLVLVLDVDGRARGVFCAALSRSPWSPIGVASEQILWIDPSHRGGMAVLQMLRTYLEWAQAMGCARAYLVALSGRSLDRLYRRAGFAPSEITFEKVL